MIKSCCSYARGVKKGSDIERWLQAEVRVEPGEEQSSGQCLPHSTTINPAQSSSWEMSAWKCGHGGGVLVPSGAPALPAPKRPSELFAQALQCYPSCYPTGSMGSPKGFHPWSAGLFFPRFSTEEKPCGFSHGDRKLWGAQKLHIRRWPRKRKATPGTQEATSSCWEDTQGWVTFGQSTVPVPSLTRQMSVWLTSKGSNAHLTQPRASCPSKVTLNICYTTPWPLSADSWASGGPQVTQDVQP